MSWELVGGKDYDMTDDGSGEMRDKIVHGTCEGDKLRERYKEVPHYCDDPKCPGNINRQKLEIFQELVKIMDKNLYLLEDTCGQKVTE